MKKIIHLLIIFSVPASFVWVYGCNGESANEGDSAYIETTDSLNQSLEASADRLQDKGEELEDALDEMAEEFDNEID